MKLVKLKDDHYVVVDDSEIKEGDYCLMFDDYGNLFLGNQPQQYLGEQAGHHLNKGLKKITHSTEPLDKSLFFTDRVWGCERLSLGEVKELIGEVDVVKKAEEIYLKYDNNQYLYGDSLDMQLSYKAGVVDGYNQAIEDNKEKKYTEEDMFNLLKLIHNKRLDSLASHIISDGKIIDFNFWNPVRRKEYMATNLIKEFIQSIQPKTEWEVEIVDGKLKLK